MAKYTAHRHTAHESTKPPNTKTIDDELEELMRDETKPEAVQLNFDMGMEEVVAPVSKPEPKEEKKPVVEYLEEVQEELPFAVEPALRVTPISRRDKSQSKATPITEVNAAVPTKQTLLEQEAGRALLLKHRRP